jgi:hypothetical protein
MHLEAGFDWSVMCRLWPESEVIAFHRHVR